VKAPGDPTRIGLALAGGGPEGAVYEIGALRALDEAVEGLDLNDLSIYVGVSAGGFIAANLANQLTPAQMCRAIVKQEPGEHPFLPEYFFQPAFGAMGRGGRRVPRLFMEGLLEWLRNPLENGLGSSLMRMGRALPVALLDNEPIRNYLERIYTMKGRSDDFRELARKLVIVAADLESGTAVRFGEGDLAHVPISKAVQASCALPGLYPPVEIEGRHYVDGVLLKTLHASVALDEGARLVLCINPIVPVDLYGGNGHRNGDLVDYGFPSVMSQTFRTLIHSRLQVGLAAYGGKYRNADVVLFEPRRDDYRMFFTNIFAFSSRKAMAEHGYQATRRDLLLRHDELAPIFAKHGLRIRKEILLDDSKRLWRGVGVDEGGRLAEVRAVDRLSSALDRVERLI
jgi:NTE family protein